MFPNIHHFQALERGAYRKQRGTDDISDDEETDLGIILRGSKKMAVVPKGKQARAKTAALIPSRPPARSRQTPETHDDQVSQEGSFFF